MSKLTYSIRQETQNDYEAVFKVIEDAFRDEEYSDHQEQFLVERLRKSEAFIPELSLVATISENIVGHILLTRISIKNEFEEVPSLALAPVSVQPEFQGKGIGAALIHTAHQIAAELGFESVILLGHPGYYPKFGYQTASKFGIKLPFEAPDEACMALELRKDTLKNVSGIVVYPKEFCG